MALICCLHGVQFAVEWPGRKHLEHSGYFSSNSKQNISNTNNKYKQKKRNQNEDNILYDFSDTPDLEMPDPASLPKLPDPPNLSQIKESDIINITNSDHDNDTTMIDPARKSRRSRNESNSNKKKSRSRSRSKRQQQKPSSTRDRSRKHSL